MTARQAVGDRHVRFRPLYAPPGSVWADMAGDERQALPGYVQMTQAETVDWLASLPAWRGRITTTAQ